MDDPKAYWMKRIGHYFAPGEPFATALMKGYPHATKPGVRTRLGGSEPARFLISQTEALVWAPVALPPGADGHVNLAPTSDLKRGDWLLKVILDPPEAPFLAASLGMSGADADNWRMTVDRDLIVIGGSVAIWGGNAVLQVDRARFLEAIDWFANTRTPLADVFRHIGAIDRFKHGLADATRTRTALDRIVTPLSILKTYPGATEPQLLRLAARAAEERNAT